jgi:hypothetical protein
MADSFKEDLEIDIFNLHLCYLDQPTKFMKWSEKWANKVRERDQRKRFLRINIRKTPENYGLSTNPSVAAVNAAIDEDEEYLTLTWELNVFQSAKDAFLQRQRSLDGLVRLYLNGYFSGPHPSTTKIVQERSERVRGKQLEGLNRKRRERGQDDDAG